MNSEEVQYGADQIQILEGLEAVRKRPGMYIGTTASRGLHHLVYEIVDNSVDEALAGFCDHIEVTINEDNTIIVKDNGRGIPIKQKGFDHDIPIEIVTELRTGGKFDNDLYTQKSGLHGEGLTIVNFLSEWMEIEVKNSKLDHRQPTIIYDGRYVSLDDVLIITEKVDS